MLFFTLAATVAVSGAQAAPLDLPSIDPIVRYQPRQPLHVLTADGIEIAQFGTERREYVPLARIPTLLQAAVLSVEDKRFREHGGIDPKGIARAVLAWVTGGTRQGGSTITQQLVRSMLLTQRFSAERKAKEIMLALQVEKQLSKDRILEIYLNEIFLGQRAYGFAAAAQTYFGKKLEALDVAETAMLAGLPQNPYYANPLSNFARAQQRQRVVLALMHENGVITAQQLAEARARKLVLRPLDTPPQVPAAHVAEMVRQVVVERYGPAAYSRGLRVTTTLRAADQRAAYEALRDGVIAYDGRGPWRGPESQESLPAGEGPALERAAAQALKDHRDHDVLRVAIVLATSPKEVRVQLADGQRLALTGAALQRVARGLAAKAPAALKLQRGSVIRVIERTVRKKPVWAVAQWPEVEAGLVALDPRNGQVRALVGGFDFSRQPFNHVTQAWRQPGSSIKPLLVSAALEHGVMPATLVDDLPFNDGRGWNPQNSDGSFLGAISVREALAASRNLVSIRLAQFVGVEASREWIGRFGLDAQRQPADLSLALGAGSATPMQMAQAYALIANGGWPVEPVLIERITDAEGKVLFEAAPPALRTEATRAIPERNAFVLGSLLNDVTREGTAARAQARLRRHDVFGKTGTTNDAFDAWFAGYQSEVAAVAWVGHDTPRSLGRGASGASVALPIWLDYMADVLKDVRQPPTLPAPPDLLRQNGDWLYREWAGGGWVAHLSDDAGVLIAPPPAPPDALAMPDAASAPGGPQPSSAPLPAPSSTPGAQGNALTQDRPLTPGAPAQ